MRLAGGSTSVMLSAKVLSAQVRGFEVGVVLLLMCRGMDRLFTATILSDSALMGQFRGCECVRRGPRVGADENLYVMWRGEIVSCLLAKQVKVLALHFNPKRRPLFTRVKPQSELPHLGYHANRPCDAHGCRRPVLLFDLAPYGRLITHSPARQSNCLLEALLGVESMMIAHLRYSAQRWS